MVALAQHPASDASKWSAYLGLAIIAHVLLAVWMNSQPFPSVEAPKTILRVNLMSLAAPSPEAQKQVVKATPPPATAKTNMVAVETQKTAQKPIAQPSKERIKKPIIAQATTPSKTLEKTIAKDPVIVPQKPAKEPLKKAMPIQSTPSASMGKAASTVIHEARYRKQTSPRYPRRALELGYEGVTIIHAKIAPNGKPAELKISDSSGHSLLDKAAISAVKKWEFEPQQKNGRATSSWVRVPVSFIITR